MNRKASAVAAGAALAAILLHACLAGQETEIHKPESEPVPVPEPDVPLDRSVPSPIVLLHGLGGDSQAWNGLRTFFHEKGLQDGGVVRLGTDGEPQFVRGEEAERADFFTTEISDPYQSLQEWTAELKTLLEAVYRRTGEAHVVLVGHSAGGLTGRKYLVEHPGEHRVAKLVTVASPHSGSDLALLPLMLKKIRDFVSDRNDLVSRPINGLLAEIERSAGIPLDSPILDDLLPEDLNLDLAALNRSDHPMEVEYECLRALGGPAFAHWEKLKKVLAGEISMSQIDWKRFLQDLAVFLRGGNSFQGDGAVSVDSQDLRRIDFFQRHDWIKECRGVDVGHSEIKEEYQEILFAITSPARFLRVHRDGDASLMVDFHDYFAGRAKVEAYDARTGDPLKVSSPAVFQRRDNKAEVFGRVTVGLTNARRIDAVDVVVKSLDGRRYGQRILLTPAARPLPELAAPEPVVLKLLQVEEIPEDLFPIPLPGRDDSGTRSDLQVVLIVDGKEELRTSVHQDVGASVDLHEKVRLAFDPDEARITLQLWDIDVDEPSDLMGQIAWSPGKLPRGTVKVRTDKGIVVRLEVQFPKEKKIQWVRRPIVLPPGGWIAPTE